MARLKYHQAVFDLLGIAPLVSESNRRALEAATRSAGQLFPAAAIEWFSLTNSGPLLRRPGRGDEVLPFRLLIANLAATGDMRKPRFTFLSEGRNICWAFDLGDNPDPPVLVRITDNEGRESWRAASDHFSDFVFGWVWDNPRDGLTAKAQVDLKLKQVRRLSAGAIEHLATRAWPSHKTFRFQIGDGRIRVHYQPESWTNIALWAPDTKTFQSIVDHAALVGIPRTALFSDQPAASRILSK